MDPRELNFISSTEAQRLAAEDMVENNKCPSCYNDYLEIAKKEYPTTIDDELLQMGSSCSWKNVHYDEWQERNVKLTSC
jgi:hypothetical protein